MFEYKLLGHSSYLDLFQTPESLNQDVLAQFWKRYYDVHTLRFYPQLKIFQSLNFLWKRSRQTRKSQFWVTNIGNGYEFQIDPIGAIDGSFERCWWGDHFIHKDWTRKLKGLGFRGQKYFPEFGNNTKLDNNSKYWS